MLCSYVDVVGIFKIITFIGPIQFMNFFLFENIIELLKTYLTPPIGPILKDRDMKDLLITHGYVIERLNV